MISKGRNEFTAKDLYQVLIEYNVIVKASVANLGNEQEKKLEIQNMIWEVDQRGNGRISLEDIILMYKGCIMDKTGLEPKNLFYIIQFIMYGIREGEPSQSHKVNYDIVIRPCDTYELIFLRLPEDQGNKIDKVD